MNESLWQARIGSVNSALLALLFVLLPTQIAPAYVVSGLLLLCWLVEGRFRDKWLSLRGNPVFWIFQAYVLWFAVSLAWTADLAAGLGMLKRHGFFILAAIYFTAVRTEHRQRYLMAFAAGVVACELMAAYNWLHLNHYPQWPDGIRADKDSIETAPFVDRVMFGPIVAFAGYVGAWQAWVNRGKRRVVWALTVATALVNLSFSGSRTGMVVFILMMALLAFQMLAGRRVFASVVASAAVAVSALGLYALADPVSKHRIGLVYAEAGQLDSAVNESIPHRYMMAVNTLVIIAEQPWLGVGAGDFVADYAAVNSQRSPDWKVPTNPHNQLLFTVVTTGVVGGALLLAVWFAPPWLARRWPDDGLRVLRVGLPVFYFVICLSESFLWRTNTTLMFVLFSAWLYGPGFVPSVTSRRVSP